jgi:hypothetical protein
MQLLSPTGRQIIDAHDTGTFEKQIAIMLADLESRMGLLGFNSTIAPRNSINASFRVVDIPALDAKRWVWSFENAMQVKIRSLIAR